MIFDNYISFINVYISYPTHIRLSAAYRSRIYDNFDTPRSEPYFARATYVPRTCDVPATFLCGVSVTYLYSYGISFSYVRRIKVYVPRTYDVCMVYDVYSCIYCVPFLSAAYLFCTNCSLIQFKDVRC